MRLWIIFQSNINFEKQNELSLKDIILKKVMFWNMPMSDLDGSMHKVWLDTVDKINKGQYDDFIKISDGEIAHIPPKWTEVGELMRELCEFINDEEKFIHPIVKASIIHFMIGYIHPFKDGNGRTARALFYWFLLKKGYKSVKNISISRAILDSRTQYDKAFLKTEYDENDLNYFIHYSIKNISSDIK